MMAESTLCIFDLTTHKPSVAAEYGIARGRGYPWAILAYPAASLVFGQVADGVAELNPFGGMGADGAVSTPEAVFDDLSPAGTIPTPLPDKVGVRNLRGDEYISGHGAITGNEVVYAVRSEVLRS